MSWDWEQQRRDEKLAREIGQEVGNAVGEQLDTQLGKLSDDIVGAIGYQSAIQEQLHDEKMFFDTLSKNEKIEYLQQKALEQERQRQQAYRMQLVQNETDRLQSAAATENYLSGDLNWWQSILSVFIRPALGFVAASIAISLCATARDLNEVIGPFYFWIWIAIFALGYAGGKPIKKRILSALQNINKVRRGVERNKESREHQKLLEASKEFK